MTFIFLLFTQVIALPEQPNIQLEIVGQPAKGGDWAFFAPHENENVANPYVKELVLQHGGVFVILRQDGKRLLHLDVDPFQVWIDPNRIFTDAGRRKNILKLNPGLRTNSYVYRRALLRSRSLAQLILNALGGIQAASTWVAIHNNTQGFQGDDKQGIGDISISRYQQKLAQGAGFLLDVSVSHGDEDDLFYVTDATDFAAMQQAGWNVVLQHPQVATETAQDDGSLSVFAQKTGIRYINIEAERRTDQLGENHLQVQHRMIDFVLTLLPDKPDETAGQVAINQ